LFSHPTTSWIKPKRPQARVRVKMYFRKLNSRDVLQDLTLAPRMRIWKQ
jgi:hypothetical protein